MELGSQLEYWQLIAAVPIALAGGVGAALVQRRPARLGRVLLVFALFASLVGASLIVFAREAIGSTIELRVVLIAGKIATIFGLILMLGASGLSRARRRTAPTVT